MSTLKILVDIRANRFAEVSTCQIPASEVGGQKHVRLALAEGFAVCPVCIGNLHPDGACRFCESHYQRAGHMVGRARGRLDFDWFELTPAQRVSLERVQKNFDLAWATAERDARTAPNGCSRCGIVERGHGQRHGCGPDGKWGGWRTPSNRLRLDRMLARRAAAQGRLYAAVDRLFFRWMSTGVGRTVSTESEAS